MRKKTTTIDTSKQSLVRKFVGFFKGQIDFIKAEKHRRGNGVSMGVIVREIFDLGIPAYREMYKLPPTYPNKLIDITNNKNF